MTPLVASICSIASAGTRWRRRAEEAAFEPRVRRARRGACRTSGTRPCRSGGRGSPRRCNPWCGGGRRRTRSLSRNVFRRLQGNVPLGAVSAICRLTGLGAHGPASRRRRRPGCIDVRTALMRASTLVPPSALRSRRLAMPVTISVMRISNGPEVGGDVADPDPVGLLPLDEVLLREDPLRPDPHHDVRRQNERRAASRTRTGCSAAVVVASSARTSDGHRRSRARRRAPSPRTRGRRSGKFQLSGRIAASDAHAPGL